MADDADAFDAQQWSTAVFGVVEALLEVGEGLARKQKSYLAGDGSLQRFLQQESHGLDHALRDLEGNITDEAIADEHVGLAVVQVAALDVADKIHRQFLDELVGLA